MKIDIKKFALLFTTVLFLGICSHASASIVWVEDITFTVGGGEVYNSSDGFKINASPGALTFADMRVAGATEYDYSVVLSTAVLTFTPCALQLPDQSSGGVAKGNFAAGARLTVTGDLIPHGGGQAYAEGITILEAVMVKDETETWIIQEDAVANGNFDGSADFNPVVATDLGKSLYDGIDLGNGDELRIGDFDCDVSFVGLFPANPGDFSEGITAMNIELRISAVPEPCTILLMAVGGCCVLRKKRQTSSVVK
jgi:hypothetical protein